MKICSADGCGREARSKGLCIRHYARMRRLGTLTVTRNTGSFWEKVAKGAPDECWPWKGYTRGSGHGLTSHHGLMMNASRKAWILTYGRIRGELGVLHKCDNGICCNPAHLYLGTKVDNMIDMWMKPPADQRGARGDRFSAKLTDEQLAEVYQMRLKGATLKECAEKTGVHFSTICRLVTAWRRAKLAKLRRDRMTA